MTILCANLEALEKALVGLIEEQEMHNSAPLVAFAQKKGARVEFTVQDTRAHQAIAVGNMPFRSVKITATIESDFTDVLNRATQMMTVAKQYNTNVNNDPTSRMQSGALKTINPDFLEINQWVLTKSPCIFKEEENGEVVYYNRIRLKHKGHKKKRNKSDRSKADDAKIRFYFKDVDETAWLDYLASLPTQNPQGRILADIQRAGIPDDSATSKAVENYIIKGELPHQLYDSLRKLVLGDINLHTRLWRSPINATGAGEYETFRVIPMLESPKPNLNRVYGGNIISATVYIDGQKRHFTKGDGLKLQNPKNKPAFILRARGNRNFFVTDPDHDILALIRNGKSKGDEFDPNAWVSLDPMDTFLRSKAAKAINAWL